MSNEFRGKLVRGSQLQNKSVTAEIIADQAISNIHINNNANIGETKLDINWHNHPEALQDKKIVNYVQITGLPASGTYINLQTYYPEITNLIRTTSNGTTEGIIIDSPKNYVYIVDSETKQSVTVTTESGTYTVHGRVTYLNNNYILTFYIPTYPNETPYNFGTITQDIDINYPRRFNLYSMDEMLFSGSKFVQGSSTIDIDTSLDLQQLAKDIYGQNWSLNHNGNPILNFSLVKQINDEFNRASTIEANLSSNLNDLLNRINVLEGDISTVNSVNYKIENQVFRVLEMPTGAADIGISYIEGLPNDVTTVQEAIAYLKQYGGNVSGDFSRPESIYKYFSIESFNTLGARLIDDNSIIDENLNRIDNRDLINRSRPESINQYFSSDVKLNINERFIDVENVLDITKKEIVDSRGVKAALNERISVSLNADGTLVDADKLHHHIKYTTQISTPISQIDIPEGYYFNINEGGFNIMVNPLQVYVNGILQANGIHFLEIPDTVDNTKGKSIDFSPSILVIGDIVTLEWPAKIDVDTTPTNP